MKFESTSALKFIASLDQERGLAEVLALLAHAVRTVRLAPQDAALREHLLDDLLVRVQRGLDGPATVQVHPFELYKDGLMVYQDHNRAESLAVQLFRCGVASLTLTPEIDRQGLDALIESLALLPGLSGRQGRDIVVRLWREQPPGLGLEERPGFALEMINRSQDIPSTPFYAGITSALQMFSPTPAQRPTPATASRERWPVSAWDTLEAQLADVPQPTLEPIASAQAQVTLVGDALGGPKAATESTTLNLIHALLLAGGERALNQLYAHLKAEDTPTAHRLMAKGASPESLMQVLQGMDRDMEVVWVARFFATQTKATPDELRTLFTHTLTTHALRLLTHTLWHHPDVCQEHWSTLLDQVRVGVALEILKTLADAYHPDPRLLAIHLRACLHRDAAVRCQALHDVGHLQDPRLQPIVMMSLKDPDSSVRMEALRRLREQRDPAVGILLVDRVRRPGFWLMPNDERRLLLTLLIELGGIRYGAFLLDQLDRAETHLSRVEALGRNTDQELRVAEALLEAISQLPDPSLLHALERRLVLSVPPSLEEAYEHAQVALRITLDGAEPPPPPRTAPVQRGRSSLPTLPSLHREGDEPQRHSEDPMPTPFPPLAAAHPPEAHEELERLGDDGQDISSFDIALPRPPGIPLVEDLPRPPGIPLVHESHARADLRDTSPLHSEGGSQQQHEASYDPQENPRNAEPAQTSEPPQEDRDAHAPASSREPPFIEDLLESYLRDDASLASPTGASGLWSTVRDDIPLIGERPSKPRQPTPSEPT
ncbi:MAG: HEAT repeat domain-containing protein [Myxococcota bacterium]